MYATIRDVITGTLTGIVFMLGWCFFVDGSVNTPDAFPALHIVPALMVTVSAMTINMVSISKVATNNAAKVWIFFWSTVGLLAVGWAIWIRIREYPPPTPSYPGDVIIIQTILVYFSAFIFFIGGRPLFAEDYEY